MNTTNLENTINIVIPCESIQTVVTLLLSNKISFTLTSFGKVKPTENETATLIKKSTGNDIILKDRTGKNDVIEIIYRKYIIEEIEWVPPTENEIAAEYRIPLAKFKSLFKEKYGKPFYQIYMDKRMEYAAKLLRQGYKSVEVSKRIGYGEKSSIKFNKMFQKHFGMTPKKYQMSQKK